MFALKPKQARPEIRRALRLVDGESEDLQQQSFFRREFTILNLAALLLVALYAVAFWNDVARYWFHPGWTTDDALQQVYPFYSVFHPHIFQNDLITEVMVGYLAPIHYWLCYTVTWLSGDPIMMSHWVMLIQAVLSAAFLFLAVRHAAGTAPAFVAVLWLLHSRQIMQRMTGGLPRGWAAPVLAAYLYFVLKKNHIGVFLTLLVGCLLHPPATFICAASYGLYLCFGILRRATRAEFLRPFIILAILSPLYCLITWSVVKRPAHVGQMVSYEEAAEMPVFQYPHGRFPFVPLRPASSEVRLYAFQSFIGRFFNPDRVWKETFLGKLSEDKRFWNRNLRSFVVYAFVGLIIIGALRRRAVLPAQLMSMLLAVFVVYFAARAMAFKLYVPNRHLQFPMGFFWMAAFTIVPWRALHGIGRKEKERASKPSMNGWRDTSLRSAWPAALGLLCVAGIVYVGSGTGLYGEANFNYSSTKKGNAFLWIRKNTAEDATIAGHPTYIDGVMLFGMRRGYITTETAHPFYRGYYNEVRRRLEISLRAHYATSLQEMLDLVEPEGIDYFLFERKRFYPSALANAEYHPPLDSLVKELAKKEDVMAFAYRQLPKKVDRENFPFMPFKDRYGAVVDVAALRSYLDSIGKSNEKNIELKEAE